MNKKVIIINIIFIIICFLLFKFVILKDAMWSLFFSFEFSLMLSIPFHLISYLLVRKYDKIINKYSEIKKLKNIHYYNNLERTMDSFNYKKIYTNEMTKYFYWRKVKNDKIYKCNVIPSSAEIVHSIEKVRHPIEMEQYIFKKINRFKLYLTEIHREEIRFKKIKKIKRRNKLWVFKKLLYLRINK